MRAGAAARPRSSINSCAPNSFVRVAQGRIWFHALRVIEARKEVTLDYTSSQHPGRRCRCGSTALPRSDALRRRPGARR